MTVGNSDGYVCRICGIPFADKSAAIEHFKGDHEPLELYSYVASTMMLEQDRDKDAEEFHRRFQEIKRELTQE